MLCKTNHFEQEWNVAAIERIRAGKSLDDIKNVPAYISLIDEWIDKGNNDPLKIYRQRMLQEAAKLAVTVKEIAESLIKDNKTIK